MFDAIRTAFQRRKIKPAEDNFVESVEALKQAITALETNALGRLYARSYVEAILLSNSPSGSPEKVKEKYLQTAGRTKEEGEIHLALIAHATAAVSKAIDVLLIAKGVDGDPTIGGIYVKNVLGVLAEEGNKPSHRTTARGPPVLASGPSQPFASRGIRSL